MKAQDGLFYGIMDGKDTLIKNEYKSKVCKTKTSSDLLKIIMPAWQNGTLSNYDYLMLLNVLSGRSFNDLSQYPIMPWVIAQFSQDELDLMSLETYRNFAYPIAA